MVMYRVVSYSSIGPCRLRPGGKAPLHHTCTPVPLGETSVYDARCVMIWTASGVIVLRSPCAGVPAEFECE